jgi:hypothetical protein
MDATESRAPVGAQFACILASPLAPQIGFSLELPSLGIEIRILEVAERDDGRFDVDGEVIRHLETLH